MTISSIEQEVSNIINSLDAELRKISIKIHDNPELSYQEIKAHDLLTDYLEQKGFIVTRHASGLNTGFFAEYSNGPGKRVGFCSEYDALPGVGHACGHNLIAIAGLACAIATKNLLEKNLLQGSVVLFGTPAEEKGSGKIDMLAHGDIQSRVDFCMMLHPSPLEGVYGLMLALDSVTVEYFGKPSHAAGAPFNGRNAVDALMQAYNNIAMLRQQTLPTNRVHGIVTNGGSAPNIIPEYSSGFFYARSVTREQLKTLKEKINDCLEAAAIATETTVKYQWGKDGIVEDVFQNDTLAAHFMDFMENEGVKFEPKEWQEKQASGSTDFGNISYAVPGLHPSFKIVTKGPNHSYEFTEAARTEDAHWRTLRASKCLTLTAAKVMTDDKVYEKVVADFVKGKQE
ncbi:hypothetical protein BGW37DRAFT_107593 [Umbelopsis sp. PMI_123]|nr:hypothetical protein BGW37DRAFT_107593 [Umbelopsis sp. PMI_123]